MSSQGWGIITQRGSFKKMQGSISVKIHLFIVVMSAICMGCPVFAMWKRAAPKINPFSTSQAVQNLNSYSQWIKEKVAKMTEPKPKDWGKILGADTEKKSYFGDAYEWVKNKIKPKPKTLEETIKELNENQEKLRKTLNAMNRQQAAYQAPKADIKMKSQVKPVSQMTAREIMQVDGARLDEYFVSSPDAYRDLAMKFHPDINKDKEAGDAMKKINSAWASYKKSH